MNKSFKKLIAFVIINYVIDELDSPVQKKNVLTIGGKDYPLVTAQVYRECEVVEYVLFHSYTLPEGMNILDMDQDDQFDFLLTLGNGVLINISINADGTIAWAYGLVVLVVENGTIKVYFLDEGLLLDDIASYNYHESTKKISFEINEARSLLMGDTEVDTFFLDSPSMGPLLSVNYTDIVLDKNIINSECGEKAVNKRAGWFKGSKSMMERGRKNRL